MPRTVVPQDALVEKQQHVRVHVLARQSAKSRSRTRQTQSRKKLTFERATVWQADLYLLKYSLADPPALQHWRRRAPTKVAAIVRIDISLDSGPATTPSTAYPPAFGIARAPGPFGRRRR